MDFGAFCSKILPDDVPRDTYSDDTPEIRMYSALVSKVCTAAATRMHALYSAVAGPLDIINIITDDTFPFSVTHRELYSILPRRRRPRFQNHADIEPPIHQQVPWVDFRLTLSPTLEAAQPPQFQVQPSRNQLSLQDIFSGDTTRHKALQIPLLPRKIAMGPTDPDQELMSMALMTALTPTMPSQWIAQKKTQPGLPVTRTQITADALSAIVPRITISPRAASEGDAVVTYVPQICRPSSHSVPQLARPLLSVLHGDQGGEEGEMMLPAAAPRIPSIPALVLSGLNCFPRRTAWQYSLYLAMNRDLELAESLFVYVYQHLISVRDDNGRAGRLARALCDHADRLTIAGVPMRRFKNRPPELEQSKQAKKNAVDRFREWLRIHQTVSCPLAEYRTELNTQKIRLWIADWRFMKKEALTRTLSIQPSLGSNVFSLALRRAAELYAQGLPNPSPIAVQMPCPYAQPIAMSGQPIDARKRATAERYTLLENDQDEINVNEGRVLYESATPSQQLFEGDAGSLTASFWVTFPPERLVMGWTPQELGSYLGHDYNEYY